MQAGTAYLENHDQVNGVVYRKICAKYELEVPVAKWATPPKVIEKDRAMILWDFEIKINKMVVDSEPDI